MKPKDLLQNRKTAKRTRAFLFIARCLLVYILPLLRCFFLKPGNWIHTSIWPFVSATLQWSLAYILFLIVEGYVRFSTRQIQKEPIFLKFALFTAVISPVFLTLLINDVLYLVKQGHEANLFQDLLASLFSTYYLWVLSYISWPWTFFWIYELVLAILITAKNKRDFPKITLDSPADSAPPLAGDDPTEGKKE